MTTAVTITVEGQAVDARLRVEVTARLGEALRRLRVVPIAARAIFTDEDGPKGGATQRCALTIGLPYRAEVHVERLDVRPRLAFAAALDAIERQLERYRERARDERRHPKKYYAARRAAEGRDR
ncbi:MAG: HPF/RaiA family ribosome-associated protein [Candidatus Rokubacteria bacterium]|nr:HPF/RaiA family ribosome-associated protein [Candidatus Rokubacteria bacterium]